MSWIPERFDMDKKRIFITGMGRSGTSLLEKLLCSHPDIDVLPQPFPLLFVDVKRQFLELSGKKQYFVLNDDKLSREYSNEAFTSYLSTLQMSTSDVEQLFEQMIGYSGQKTRPNRKPSGIDGLALTTFKEVMDFCFEHFTMQTNAVLHGSKEIMCEEFLSYLGACGYKCILIVRDPRDVLASANYPKNERFLGAKKPTLFILRSWRKSVEFAWMLRNEPFFHFLRYEDLVGNPLKELDEIAEFLEVEPQGSHWTKGEIHDRAGELWRANSSHQGLGTRISSASMGSYPEILHESEIAYSESVCRYEMEWLGYSNSQETDPIECIRGFRDLELEDIHGLGADFSQQSENIQQELRRLRDFRDFYSCS